MPQMLSRTRTVPSNRTTRLVEHWKEIWKLKIGVKNRFDQFLIGRGRRKGNGETISYRQKSCQGISIQKSLYGSLINDNFQDSTLTSIQPLVARTCQQLKSASGVPAMPDTVLRQQGLISGQSIIRCCFNWLSNKQSVFDIQRVISFQEQPQISHDLHFSSAFRNKRMDCGNGVTGDHM